MPLNRISRRAGQCHPHCSRQQHAFTIINAGLYCSQRPLVSSSALEVIMSNIILIFLPCLIAQKAELHNTTHSAQTNYEYHDISEKYL